MTFEWDPAKDAANRRKHGVSFTDAMQIWEDIHINIENIAHCEAEFRSSTLGLIHNKVYLAIWTMRGPAIRLISVRRARKHEEKIYNERIQHRE